MTEEKRKSWIFWSIVGVIAIAVITEGFEIGDYGTPCNNSQIAKVNAIGKWECSTDNTGNTTSSNGGGWVNDTKNTNTTLNANIKGKLNVEGNVTADYFIGDGSLLTGVATSSDDFNIYFTSSIKNEIIWNLTESDDDEIIYDTSIFSGNKYIFGGRFK